MPIGSVSFIVLHSDRIMSWEASLLKVLIQVTSRHARQVQRLNVTLYYTALYVELVLGHLFQLPNFKPFSVDPLDESITAVLIINTATATYLFAQHARVESHLLFGTQIDVFVVGRCSHRR